MRINNNTRTNTLSHKNGILYSLSQKVKNIIFSINTCFFLLFVEIVDNHTNKQVKSEKRAENYEEYKIEVHVVIDLTNRLFPVYLKKKKLIPISTRYIKVQILVYTKGLFFFF